MRIDPEIGVFSVGLYAISPELTKQQFLDSALGEEAELGAVNAGWESWFVCVEDGEDVFALTFQFRKGRIYLILFDYYDPYEPQGGGLSVEEQKSRIEELLAEMLGRPPYHFDWGEVGAEMNRRDRWGYGFISYQGA